MITNKEFVDRYRGHRFTLKHNGHRGKIIGCVSVSPARELDMVLVKMDDDMDNAHYGTVGLEWIEIEITPLPLPG